MWSPSPSFPTKEISDEEIWYFVEDLSADIFLLDEAIAEEPWLLTDYFYDLPVAPEEEWPCEWEDALAWSEGGTFDEAVGEFGVDAFSLLCGRQQVS